MPVRFVEPAAVDRYYEVGVFETGRVATRPDSLHDWFNALVWLAFPRTKARINALHAATIPTEAAGRGRFRDMLTLFDEGGALVACGDVQLISHLKNHRWKELFWQERKRVLASMRVLVIGHAVLEQAREPWPGITCKAIFVDPARDADTQAVEWLGARPADATPRELASLPVFGYPGWLEGSAQPEFYDDARYFRPRR